MPLTVTAVTLLALLTLAAEVTPAPRARAAIVEVRILQDTVWVLKSSQDRLCLISIEKPKKRG